MSAVSEWIAREYFETVGFFVMQPRKYGVPARHKTVAEEIDLLLVNPSISEHAVPTDLIWATEDVMRVKHAVVGIRGWHTERFSASTFANMPEILRFAEADAMRLASERLATDKIARIICLPQLPASGPLREKTVEFLRTRGIDGVVLFKTMLQEIIARIDKNANYEKSDLLQVLRILKSYNIVNDSQLDLFAHRTKSRRKKSILRRNDNITASGE